MFTVIFVQTEHVFLVYRLYPIDVSCPRQKLPGAITRRKGVEIELTVAIHWFSFIPVLSNFCNRM